MIPLLGEMSAKQTKGCPNSENFAPAAGVAVNSETGTDRSLHTKLNFYGRAGACSRRKVPEREAFCSPVLYLSCKKDFNR